MRDYGVYETRRDAGVKLRERKLNRWRRFQSLQVQTNLGAGADRRIDVIRSDGEGSVPSRPRSYMKNACTKPEYVKKVDSFWIFEASFQKRRDEGPKTAEIMINIK